jgi:vitamin B12 transporter
VVLSVGTAFRAPDATDLYGFGGNPDLDPEESTGYELSFRRALGERQAFSIALFRNDIDDLIDFFVTDPDTFEGENRNVDRARIDGVEAAWHYAGEAWSASVAATWQDARDRATDERLLRRARENYTAAVARRFGPHEVALDVLYAGERRDFGFPSQTVLDPYTLVNLAAKLALGERFTLVLRAENLFDEDYELASGFNTMGQAFFGALRYEFR